MKKIFSKVSIIMSVYNETDIMLKESIESMLNQTYKDFEYIIILDNPLNISAKKILLNYKNIDDRIIIYENKKNIGLAKSLNKALDLAEGEFIARMDADDISCLDRIEKQVCYLNNNIEVDLIGTKVCYIDEENNKLDKENVLMIQDDEIQRRLPYSSLFNHPTWMFRCEVLKDVKGYRAFSSSQDYDFILRMKYYGYKFNNIDQVMLQYRIRSNSISVSKEIVQLKMFLYIQQLYFERKRNGCDSFDLEYIQTIEEGNELQKFKKAYNLYKKAKISLSEKKYFRTLFYLTKSLLHSKNQRRFFYNSLVLKLIILQERFTEKI